MKNIATLLSFFYFIITAISSKAGAPTLTPQLTIEQLRTFDPELNTSKAVSVKYMVCYVTDSNKEGMFKLEIPANGNNLFLTDISSEDDGVMTIVSHPANNRHYYKFTRIVDKYINVKWFGSSNGLQKISQQSQSKIAELTRLFNKYSPFETAGSNIYNDTTSSDPAMANWQNNTLDWLALQTSINYCVNSKSNKTLFIPIGNYNISRELFIRKARNVTTYEQCQMVIEGESSYSGATGSIIIALFNDKFALGVQEGRGIKIKGLSFQGQFMRDNAVKMEDRDFYSSTLENSGKNSYNRFFKPCKDRRFAPYAAIVLDPFKNSLEANEAIKSFDEYYAELKYYYFKKCGTSSGTEIVDVQFNGFIAGIVFSPNGSTQGNDVSKIEKGKFANLKYGICFSQDQEKTNTIRHIYAWLNVHTLIASSSQNPKARVAFGSGTSGNQIIEDVNVAGNVNQLIFREDGGRFALYIKNVFSERLGKIGYLGSKVGGTFEDSQLGFAYPINSTDSNFQGLYPDWHLKGYSFTFKNCLIRYYTSGSDRRWPVSMFGNFRFENCVFNTVPFYSQELSSEASFIFTNCRTIMEGDFGLNGIKTTNPVHLFTNVAYGNFTLHSSFDKKNNKLFTYKNPIASDIFDLAKVAVNSINKRGEIALPINREHYKNYFKYAKLVVYNLSQDDDIKPLGIIKNYDTVNNLLYVGGVSESVTEKDIYIGCIIPIVTIEPFWGDIQKGTNCNRINNIRKENINHAENEDLQKVDPNLYIGKALLIGKPTQCINKTEAGKNGFRNFGTGQYVIIKSYDSITNSFEVTPYVADKDYTKIYFCNGCQKNQ